MNSRVEPNIQDQSVSGKNTIFFEITKDVENPTFQLDLQKPMNSKKISWEILIIPK